MTVEHYYLGAYWGNRKESAAQCAERAVALLQSLRACDEVFARWFERGRSRQDALRRPVEPSSERLLGLIERGVHRRDNDRRVIEDLGFRIGIWNGGPDDEAVGLGLLCGCYASTKRVWIPNSCVINLPSVGPAAERVLRIGVLTCVMASAVRACAPDYAVVTSNTYRDLTPKAEPGTPLVGWLTYLSARYGPIPDLPSPVRVLRVEELGSLIVVVDERFTASNAQHVALADRVRATLANAGLLRRIQ